MERQNLINRLKNETKVLEEPLIFAAFEKIDRADFVGEDYKVEAYEDYALPTKAGQTISQPTTVAFMLELLDVKPGEKVLDVGSGSGYTTALLGEIVGPNGHVWGTEIIPELVEEGQKNIKKYSQTQTEIVQAEEGKIGLKQDFLYDRILVNASANQIPEELIAQLEVGGILVIPIQDTIVQVRKISEDKTDEKEFPGFVFVPLV